MYKKYVLYLLLAILGTRQGQAQVQVIQLPANSFQFSSEDIWAINLISPFDQSFTASAIGQIIGVDGKVVVELQSGNFTVSPGFNSFNATNLTTTRKNYWDKDVQEIEEITGSLPAGAYRLCVRLNCLNASCDGLNEEAFTGEIPACIDLVLEPPTPLILAYPEDLSSIETTQPALTWIPPMPIASSANLVYSLTLSEMREGQGKIDALKRNRPLINQTDIASTTLPYPLDLDELEEGKKYSWQVVAWVGHTKVGTSEVWEFEIEEKQEEPKDSATSYVRINQNTGIHNFEGILHFIYQENQAVGEVKIELYNARGKPIDLETEELSSVFGENKYAIDLTSYPEVRDGDYELHLTNMAGQRFVLRFSYSYSRN